MKVSTCEKLARKALRDYGLLGWKIVMTQDRKNFGVCDWNSETIYISIPCAMINSRKQCMDTILHEVAHALAGPKVAPHGRKWKSICRRIGAVPEEFVDETVTAVPYRWKLTCPKCSRTIPRMRRHEGVNCFYCSKKYGEKILYQWESNILEESRRTVFFKFVEGRDTVTV